MLAKGTLIECRLHALNGCEVGETGGANQAFAPRLIAIDHAARLTPRRGAQSLVQSRAHAAKLGVLEKRRCNRHVASLVVFELGLTVYQWPGSP